jgi:hypothetical protein
MENALQTLTLLTAMAMSPAALAADKATDTPPQNTPIYPCWDMMKDGKMMQMRGMWHGNPQNHMLMMQQQDVLQMQKEIDDLRKEVEELKKKQ